MRRVTVVVLALVILLCVCASVCAEKFTWQEGGFYDLSWLYDLPEQFNSNEVLAGELHYRFCGPLSAEDIARVAAYRPGDSGVWLLPRFPWGPDVWRGELREITIEPAPWTPGWTQFSMVIRLTWRPER